jgi:hypothetical protein
VRAAAADPEVPAAGLGACLFNRFGGTCGEYNSPKRSIRSLGFYVSLADWHA